MTSQRDLQKAILLHQGGKHAEALEQFETLRRGDPGNPHLYHFQALIKCDMGDPAGAIPLFAKAIELNPASPVFHRNLVKTLITLGDTAQAALAWAGLGNALQQTSQFEEAIQAYDESLRLAPDSQPVKSARLLAIQHLGARGKDLRGASLQVIAELAGRAKTPAEYISLGIAYQAVLDHEKAIAAYDAAIALEPDYAAAHMNKAGLLLLEGKWTEGWQEDEWRWHAKSMLLDKVRYDLRAPLWKGESPEDINGNLLIVSEQGFGDTLQFSRYVTLLLGRGYKILFEVQQPLVSLMRQSLKHPNIRVIPRLYYRWDKWDMGWLEKALGRKPQLAGHLDIYHDLPFAAWIGTMSLPLRYGTTPQTVPADTPYLSVSPGDAKRWKKIVDSAAGETGMKRIKAGLVWAGSADHMEDFNRSLTLDRLAPVLSQSHVRFYSLQKDVAAAQVAAHKEVVDLSGKIKDFNDTAAVMQNLDLVITVDTAAAHLAGALGKPVWILIPHVKDWRWGKSGSSNPWYPSARLFRQHEQGDWTGVLNDLAGALQALPGEGVRAAPR